MNYEEKRLMLEARRSDERKDTIIGGIIFLFFCLGVATTSYHASIFTLEWYFKIEKLEKQITELQQTLGECANER